VTKIVIEINGVLLSQDERFFGATSRALALDTLHSEMGVALPTIALRDPSGALHRSEVLIGDGRPLEVLLEEHGVDLPPIVVARLHRDGPSPQLSRLAAMISDQLRARGLPVAEPEVLDFEDVGALDQIRTGSGIVIIIAASDSQPVEPTVELPPVYLQTPAEPLYVGAWAEVPVTIDPSSGFSREDLEFDILEGPGRGMVSESRESDRQAGASSRHTIMLLAGVEPGPGTLEVRHRSTSVVLNRAPFEVSEHLSQHRDGPSLWFTDQSGEGAVAGAAWGGGLQRIQNYKLKELSGMRKIAIIPVDTKSDRFPTDAASVAALKKEWMDEVIDGADDGGVKKSARIYYQELSLQRLDLSADVYDPIHLDDTVDDILDGSTLKADAVQRIISAAAKNNPLFKQRARSYRAILMIVRARRARSKTERTPAVTRRAVWPSAYGRNLKLDNQLYLPGLIQMPDDWSARGHKLHETVAHELGHIWGIDDQYSDRNPRMINGTTTEDVPPKTVHPSRAIKGWDIMHSAEGLPHMCLFHRLVLGWLDADWIADIKFSDATTTFNQRFKLSPIERGSPPTGHKAGLEIRLADGWNWYVEYRRGQTDQIGDRSLPKDGHVLITDCIQERNEPPIYRKHVLLAEHDRDGDGSVLTVGDDLKAVDSSHRMSPMPFMLKVLSITPQHAEVQVTYGVDAKPDPSIRPWPASPTRPWQSPDIEVTNARSKADPKWRNVPWAGNENMITARYHNRGGADAPAVRVDFFVKNFNIGGRPRETWIGTDTKDIAAGKQATFSCAWRPPRKGHFCVVARAPLYQLPAAPYTAERSEANNSAQSNYTRFISKSSSPFSRESTYVEVANPHPVTVEASVRVRQTNPFYRTYIDHRWVSLAPGETRRIKVMTEYDPRESNRLDIPLAQYQGVANTIDIAGLLRHPEHCMPELAGGACLEIVHGRATEFSDIERRGPNSFEGFVRTIDDDTPVPGGAVIASLWRRSSAEKVNSTTELVDGRFELTLPEDWESLTLEYLPPDGLGDCETEEILR